MTQRWPSRVMLRHNRYPGRYSRVNNHTACQDRKMLLSGATRLLCADRRQLVADQPIHQEDNAGHHVHHPEIIHKHFEGGSGSPRPIAAYGGPELVGFLGWFTAHSTTISIPAVLRCTPEQRSVHQPSPSDDQHPHYYAFVPIGDAPPFLGAPTVRATVLRSGGDGSSTREVKSQGPTARSAGPARAARVMATGTGS